MTDPEYFFDAFCLFAIQIRVSPRRQYYRFYHQGDHQHRQRKNSDEDDDVDYFIVLPKIVEFVGYYRLPALVAIQSYGVVFHPNTDLFIL